MTSLPWDLQLLNTLAALLLLLSFAMLSQRRIVGLVNLLALQGALLFSATLLLAWRTGDRNLYVSAALTLGLKVIFLALAIASSHSPPRRLLGYGAIAQYHRNDAGGSASRDIFIWTSATDFGTGEHSDA